MFKSRARTKRVRQSTLTGQKSRHFPFSTPQSTLMGKRPRNPIRVRQSELNSTKPRGESRQRPSTYSGLATPWPKMKKAQKITRYSRMNVHKPKWNPTSARMRQSQLSRLAPNVRDLVLNQRIKRATAPVREVRGTHATVGHSSKSGQRVVITSP